MNAADARDHLQWVHGIIRTTDRSLHIPPVTLIVWGLVGAIIQGEHQAELMGLAAVPDQYFHLPAIALAIGFSVWAARRYSPGRETLADSQAGVVFLVVFGVIMMVNLTAQDSVVPVRAMGLFWSAGLSIALLIIGIQASAPLLLGGVALLAAVVTAPFFPGWFAGILALGTAAGLIAPGVFLALTRSHG